MSQSKYSPSEEEEKHHKAAERLALKKAQFEKDPSLFIHVDDVLLASVQDEEGRVGVICGAHPVGRVKQALTDINFRAFMLFQHMELRNAMKEKGVGEIITPPESGKIIT